MDIKLPDAIKILNPNEDPRKVFTIAEKYNILPQDAIGKALEMAVNVMKDAIPCGYIRAKAYKASGPESAYLKKLLDDWEKETKENNNG